MIGCIGIVEEGREERGEVGRRLGHGEDGMGGMEVLGDSDRRGGGVRSSRGAGGRVG